MRRNWIAFVICVSSMMALVGGAHGRTPGGSPEQRGDQQKLVFIGQDLSALREYAASKCCAVPDGATAYVSLYSLLSHARNYGGLGVDGRLAPIADERGWGAGPVSAWKTAAGARRLAIGLALTEESEKNGMDGIVAGRFDAQIKHLADFIKRVGKPVYLRIGYEFDGAWNPAYADHRRFVVAWRRIVDILRREEASNVVFVWQSATSPIDDLIDQGHEDIGDWYPGDRYVDWVACSWFLSPLATPRVATAGYKAPTPAALVEELLEFARQHRKPVMIAEAAPQSFDLMRRTKANISTLWDGAPGTAVTTLSPDQIWDQWFAPLFAFLRQNDDVRAIAYINVRWDDQPLWSAPYSNGYWGDSRLQANPLIARRWNAAIAQWRARRGSPDFVAD